MKPRLFLILLAFAALLSFTAAFPSGSDSEDESDDDSLEAGEAETDASDHGESEVDVSEQCYNLDRSIAKGHVPCNSHGTTNCCHSGDICLDDGLCYMQGSHGLGLSRGTCTDKNWGPKCNAPCSDFDRNVSSLPIVPLKVDGDDSEYCCNSVTWEDGEAACENGESSFALEPGKAIAGYAGLAGLIHEEDGPDPSDYAKPSVGIAVGVGIGVPLGLLGISGILWAVWERRRRDLQLAGDPSAAKAMMSVSNLQHHYGPIPDPYSRRGTPTPLELQELHRQHLDLQDIELQRPTQVHEHGHERISSLGSVDTIAVEQQPQSHL